MQKERVILHIDMNNFYASVECMLNPSLKDKCVAVGGSEKERHGIVLAKNYKAKAFGVATGETIWEAKRKCKDLVVVPPTYEQYLKFSKLAIGIYSRYTDLIEPYGMDECWLDITGSSVFGTGEEIAEKIRQTIKFELGLTVSIGVSYNKIFAKLGSDMKKPDAVTVIKKENFKEKVWNLPANELLGVGSATNKKLKSSGIHTIGQLAEVQDEIIQSWFGINGIKLKRFANGEDDSKVSKQDYSPEIKSIGHGITTIQDLENSAEVWKVMLALIQDVSTKLRNHKFKAGGVSITIKTSELVSKEWQCKLEIPTQSGLLIAKACFDLFLKRYRWDCTIRSVTVRVIDLIDEEIPFQVNLFSDVSNVAKREKLEEAIEIIRFRFGKDIIKNAVLLDKLKLPDKLDNGVIMPTGMVN